MRNLKFIIGAIILMNYSIASAEWIGIATTKDAEWAISAGNKTQKEARNKAKSSCENYTKKSCNNIRTLNTLESYVAVAQSKTWIEVATAQTMDIAVNDSLNRCASHTDKNDVCNIVWKGINRELKTPKRIISPASAKNNKSCRPNTNPIRCHSNCINGDCVVTYENGCKIQIQVSPKYDPFENRWKYPTPQC